MAENKKENKDEFEQKVIALSHYEFINRIGTGSFGTVVLVRKKENGEKQVRKDISYRGLELRHKQMLVDEVNILRVLKHSHIVKYIARIVDKKNEMLYILMEYCPGGDLAQVLKALSGYTSRYKRRTYLHEYTICSVLHQMADALKFCHTIDLCATKCVMHRDLKPANVLLDRHCNIKICDFGLAKETISHSTPSFTYVGSPLYMSPEMLFRQQYNCKTDIWSAGCIIYELCQHKAPFASENIQELEKKVKDGQYPPIHVRYPLSLERLLRSMIKTKPSKRLSSTDCFEVTKELLESLSREPHPVNELQKWCLNAKFDIPIIVDQGLTESNASIDDILSDSEDTCTKIDQLYELEYKCQLSNSESNFCDQRIANSDINSQDLKLNQKNSKKMLRACFLNVPMNFDTEEACTGCGADSKTCKCSQKKRRRHLKLNTSSSSGGLSVQVNVNSEVGEKKKKGIKNKISSFLKKATVEYDMENLNLIDDVHFETDPRMKRRSMP